MPHIVCKNVSNELALINQYEIQTIISAACVALPIALLAVSLLEWCYLLC
jgi:hypothetical protein